MLSLRRNKKYTVWQISWTGFWRSRISKLASCPPSTSSTASDLSAEASSSRSQPLPGSSQGPSRASPTWSASTGPRPTPRPRVGPSATASTWAPKPKTWSPSTAQPPPSSSLSWAPSWPSGPSCSSKSRPVPEGLWFSWTLLKFLVSKFSLPA